jgi:hypothetical protein
MTVEEVRSGRNLLLDCISGSRAYGLHTASSDTDRKGVYLMPKVKFYGLTYIEQVNNETNDEVYYELKRFVDLLVKNNPNIIELLYTPKDCIIYKNPVIDLLKPELFLSKLCQQTFAGYALAQIKKAKGLNKKIVNPVDKRRKSVIDFCYVAYDQGSIDLSAWLAMNGFQQEDCGLVNIPHMKDIYSVFHKGLLNGGNVKGVCSGEEANDVSLSSIGKGVRPLAVMSFNKDGYSKYCKDYKEYWQWVSMRNEVRYDHTIANEKNYDAKNMMHTFRLLHMAEEIAQEGKVNVRRADRAFLLDIRNGIFSYEYLVDKANEKITQIDILYERCDLPEAPDIKRVEEILVQIRDYIYKQN